MLHVLPCRRASHLLPLLLPSIQRFQGFHNSTTTVIAKKFYDILHRRYCGLALHPYFNRRKQVQALPDYISRNYSPVINRDEDEGILQRLRRRLGFAKTETKKYILRGSGKLLFIKVADEVNYTNFFEVCKMEDTFQSWFIVMELHIWLLSCRLMEEGEDGKVARTALLKAMWQDVDMRSKRLEGALTSARRVQVSDLGQQFNTQLLSYDEGLLSNDHVLAGALWRRFLQEQVPTNQEELLHHIQAVELLLAFTRSQFAKLHSLSKTEILDKEFEWLPFNKSVLGLQPQ